MSLAAVGGGEQHGDGSTWMIVREQHLSPVSTHPGFLNEVAGKYSGCALGTQTSI